MLPSVVREAVEGAAAAQEARRRGSSDPEEVQEPYWIIPDEAFAQLSFVSPDLEARVERFNAARWEELRQQDVQVRVARERLDATTPEIEADADAVVDAIRGDWKRLRETVRDHVERGSWAATV